MANLIRFDGASHWYEKDGKPRHDADLRIARKQGLYASPTSIDKAQFVNDFLNQWKMNELALAACENQRMPHESDDDYANRIYEISLTKSRIASQFGKGIHDACEKYPQMPLLPEYMPWFLEFEKWWQANSVIPHAREAVLVDHDIGVAGQVDLICDYKGRRAIVDYKSQNVKVDKKNGNKKPAYYDGFPRQLSFYASVDAKQTGLWPVLPLCVSVIIDSNPSGLVYEKVWEPEEIVSAYEDFTLAVWSWQKRKKYFPAGQWTITQNIPMPFAQEFKL